MHDTTTVAAEPNEQPAGARPLSAMRRALVWGAVLGVVALGSASLAASDLAAPAVEGGAAARFVPADGTATLVTAADGTRTVHEAARDTGPGLLLELPPLAGAPLFEESSHEELRGAQLWRESVTHLDAERPQTTTLYRLEPRGVSMVAALGGEVGFSYSPAIVMLPADAEPGVTWSGEGAAMPGGLLGYRMTGELSAAEDDCLRATTDTRYEDPATGAELLAVAETATWCPGRGVVHDEGVVAGTRVSFSSEPLPELSGVGRDVASAEAVLDWAAAPGWRSRVLALQLSDPVYGESPQASPLDGLAAASADGGFVASLGSRVAHYAVASGTATRDWVASPGGDLLTLATIGEVTLVSTAERRLLAYDARGARLWSMTFPDVVAASPVAAPDGDAVVASLDGTLRRVELATGATVWSATLRTDVAEPLAVDGELVVAVDRAGAVIARSLADGSERWRTELASAERAVAGSGIVAVQGASADVWVLDPQDGRVRWEAGHAGVARSIRIVDGWVVSQSDEGTAAWRSEGGEERRWVSSATEAVLSDGVRLALVGARSIELRAADGTLLHELALDAAPLGVTRVHLATVHGIRILHTDATGIEVR